MWKNQKIKKIEKNSKIFQQKNEKIEKKCKKNCKQNCQKKK